HERCVPVVVRAGSIRRGGEVPRRHRGGDYAMKGRQVAIAVTVALAAALAWVVFVGLPKRYGNSARPAPSFSPFSSSPSASTSTSGRTIKAKLFYIAGDGTHLTS